MRVCPDTNQPTKCIDLCRDCAKEMWKELKGIAGAAELVTKDYICRNLGENAFNMLRMYGHIEHCRVDELGRHWYAI